MGNLLFSNKIAFLSKVFISCFIRKIQYSGKNHLLLKICSPLVVGGEYLANLYVYSHDHSFFNLRIPPFSTLFKKM